MYIYIYIILAVASAGRRSPPRSTSSSRTTANPQITVPQKGYAKRGSKKRLLLSDLKVT